MLTCAYLVKFPPNLKMTSRSTQQKSKSCLYFSMSSVHHFSAPPPPCSPVSSWSSSYSSFLLSPSLSCPLNLLLGLSAAPSLSWPLRGLKWLLSSSRTWWGKGAERWRSLQAQSEPQSSLSSTWHNVLLLNWLYKLIQFKHLMPFSGWISTRTQYSHQWLIMMLWCNSTHLPHLVCEDLWACYFSPVPSFDFLWAGDNCVILRCPTVPLWGMQNLRNGFIYLMNWFWWS